MTETENGQTRWSSDLGNRHICCQKGGHIGWPTKPTQPNGAVKHQLSESLEISESLRLLFEVSTADWRIGEFAESQSLGPRPPRLLAMCYAGVSYLGRVTCARGQEERDFATWGAVVVPS